MSKYDDLQDTIYDAIYDNTYSMTDVMGCEAATDAILAALPLTIEPLVWEGAESDCFAHSEAFGYSYELVIVDALERSCDYTWRADVRYCNQSEGAIDTPAQASFEQAKTAANTHHSNAIMAAFTGEKS
jgi:hypothetical protein